MKITKEQYLDAIQVDQEFRNECSIILEKWFVLTGRTRKGHPRNPSSYVKEQVEFCTPGMVALWHDDGWYELTSTWFPEWVIFSDDVDQALAEYKKQLEREQEEANRKYEQEQKQLKEEQKKRKEAHDLKEYKRLKKKYEL